jgi:cell shape-determining protein MreC
MGVAAVLALLPTAWTRWPGGILQPLGWLQWSAASASRTAERSVRDVGREWLSPAEAHELSEQLEQLRRQLGQQAVLLADLDRQLAEITGIRQDLGEGRAQIVLAAVIGFDASPRRQTLTINKGSLSEGQIRVGQWVAAGASPDKRDPRATGRELLARQWLIGKVSRVDPYRSWVQLTSDPDFGPQVVRLAKVLPDGQWQTANEDPVLYGLGVGRMRIHQAKADYFESGHTMVLIPRSGDSPAALSVGYITGSRRLPEAPLFYDLEVEPWADPRELAYVYVISAGF